MAFRTLKRHLGGLVRKRGADRRNVRRDQQGRLPFAAFILITWLNYAILYIQIGILGVKIRIGAASDPFPNVPVFLTVVVRRLRKHANDREILYTRAAIALVAYYIDRSTPSGTKDSYLQIKELPGTAFADPAYQLRILLIAETLFLLRHSDGFLEFCRRLRQRDLRVAYYEAFAARLFWEAQYEIHTRPETMVKGEDYDFAATKNGEQVNVEVTTLAEKQFSQRTIPNSLIQKRKQLPNTAPAIIFVVLPTLWVSEPRDWDSYLMKVSNDFFKGSMRINAIVFLGEQFFPGGVVIIKKPYYNPKARIKARDIDFLVNDRSFSFDESQSSEFFRWVDYIVPK